MNDKLTEALITLEAELPPMPEPKTIVVFRKIREDGSILAVFPEEDYFNYDSQTKMSYMHIGQHSGCDLDYVSESTDPATPVEYADLANELTRSVGYNLDIQQDYQYAN